MNTWNMFDISVWVSQRETVAMGWKTDENSLTDAAPNLK